MSRFGFMDGHPPVTASGWIVSYGGTDVFVSEKIYRRVKDGFKTRARRSDGPNHIILDASYITARITEQDGGLKATFGPEARA